MLTDITMSSTKDFISLFKNPYATLRMCRRGVGVGDPRLSRDGGSGVESEVRGRRPIQVVSCGKGGI